MIEHGRLASLLLGASLLCHCADDDALELLPAVAEVVAQQELGPPVWLVGRPQLQGEGCRPGTVSLENTLSNDGQYRTELLFDSYSIKTDGLRAMSASRKCTVKLTYASRSDVSMALTNALFYGTAFFDEGVRGSIMTNAGFASKGTFDDNKRTSTFKGPLEVPGAQRTGSFTHRTPITLQHWLPCGAQDDLLIDIELTLDAPVLASQRTNTLSLSSAHLGTHGVVPGAPETPGVVTTFSLQTCFAR